MADLGANFPEIRAPLVDMRTGQIDIVWRQFLMSLYARTGAEQGSSSSGNAAAIAALQAAVAELQGDQAALDSLLDAMYALYLSQAIPALPRPSQILDIEVSSHGLQYDPAMHALATQALDGFMPATDKLKLDTTIPVFGNIAFPAVQVPSANANTLDDYEEGTWTPILTCATPGNLAITYAIQTGTYTKIGRQVFVNFVISTSAFTWTTAVGTVVINGLPFANALTTPMSGILDWSGITQAPYTQISLLLQGSAGQFFLVGNASGASRGALNISAMPSGGSVFLSGQMTYLA